MADRTVDILLVGGGIASATAAHTLREQGFDGSILLVGREPHPPYHRPPASKEYLRGEHGPEGAHVHPADWWEANGVELLTRTSVLALDTAARTATLSTKEEVGFDRALIATGAMVRRLPVDGAQLEGVHYLRALGNADAHPRRRRGRRRVVCVGGSYIASEVAASLTELGKQVTMVMLEDHPLERGFGATAGRLLPARARGARRRGPRRRRGRALRGRRARRARRDRRRARARRRTPSSAASARSPTSCSPARPGLTLGELGGVLCDSRLRTSADGIFAAGDMCEYDSVVHGRVVRIEHEEVAAAQGAHRGAQHARRRRPPRRGPLLLLRPLRLGLARVPRPALSWDDEQSRARLDDGAFAICYRQGDRVRAMLSVGGAGDLDRARELIKG